MVEVCPICNSDPCTGVSYPHMLAEYSAGNNVEHWRRIHDGHAEKAPPPDPATAQLQAHLERHGKCCH